MVLHKHANDVGRFSAQTVPGAIAQQCGRLKTLFSQDAYAPTRPRWTAVSAPSRDETELSRRADDSEVQIADFLAERVAVEAQKFGRLDLIAARG